MKQKNIPSTFPLSPCFSIASRPVSPYHPGLFLHSLQARSLPYPPSPFLLSSEFVFSQGRNIIFGKVFAALSCATVSHEISQHSAHFLPILVGIHEFCSAYVSAKYGKKHGYEWLMHVFLHLREQKLHTFRAFSKAWHSWRGGFTEVVFNICHV